MNKYRTWSTKRIGAGCCKQHLLLQIHVHERNWMYYLESMNYHTKEMLHKPLAFAKHLSAHLGCFIHNYLFYKIYKSAWKIPWFNNSAMPLFIRPTHTHKGLQRYYGQFTPPCHQKTEKWKMSQNSGSVFGLWNWLITKIQWPSRRWNSCNFLDAKQRAQSATPPPAPRAAAIWSSIATKSKAGCLL